MAFLSERRHVCSRTHTNFVTCERVQTKAQAEPNSSSKIGPNPPRFPASSRKSEMRGVPDPDYRFPAPVSSMPKIVCAALKRTRPAAKWCSVQRYTPPPAQTPTKTPPQMRHRKYTLELPPS